MSCDLAVQRALYHLHAFQVRQGQGYQDNSAAQSMRDFCINISNATDLCNNRKNISHSFCDNRVNVANALGSVDIDKVKRTENLRSIDTSSLTDASLNLQKALIPTRPFCERVHWRLAFAFPAYFEGPTSYRT